MKHRFEELFFFCVCVWGGSIHVGKHMEHVVFPRRGSVVLCLGKRRGPGWKAAAAAIGERGGPAPRLVKPARGY